MSHRTPLTFAESLESTLCRLNERQRSLLATGGTLASVLGFTGPALTGCDPAPVDEAATRAQEVIANGQTDWAQRMGLRERNMVRYYSEFWREFSGSGRYGYSGVTVFVKLRVQPVVGADLSYKKVGVVYREVGNPNPVTVNGYYFGRMSDGSEEWHVPITSRLRQGAFSFNAWYEDGKYGRWYDDNNGELYAISWNGEPGDFVTVRPDYAASMAKFTATGVKGQLAFSVIDLDYDKDLRFEWSTDDWKTKKIFGMGSAGDKNKLRWDSNQGTDFDRWLIDLDIPGSFPSFRYRLVYKHGVVSGADSVEFVGGGSAGYWMPKT